MPDHLFGVNYFCRRIASPDLLPGEHRCLRIPATEGRHDVDDQSASAAGVGNGGGRAVSAEHASREGRILDEFVALTGYHLFAYRAVGGAVISLAALLPYRRHTSAGAQPVGQRALRPVPVARRGMLAGGSGRRPRHLPPPAASRPRRRARRGRASRRTSACPGRRPRAGCRNGHAGLGLIEAARRKLGKTSTRRGPGSAPGRRGTTGRRMGVSRRRPGPPRSSPAAPPGSRSQTRSGGRARGLRVREVLSNPEMSLKRRHVSRG